MIEIGSSRIENFGEREAHVARALDARGWARDLAIVGASTSMVVPAIIGAHVGLAIASGVIGALLGVLIGSAAPVLLAWRVRRIPLVVLALAGAGLGADWGAVTAGLTAGSVGASWTWAIELGAIVGLVQLGWFWIPAIWMRARGLPTWPLVTLAVVLCPVLAVALAHGAIF